MYFAYTYSTCMKTTLSYKWVFTIHKIRGFESLCITNNQIKQEIIYFILWKIYFNNPTFRRFPTFSLSLMFISVSFVLLFLSFDYLYWKKKLNSGIVIEFLYYHGITISQRPLDLTELVFKRLVSIWLSEEWITAKFVIFNSVPIGWTYLNRQLV